MRWRDAPLWALSAAAFACLAWYFSLGHGRLDFADHARGRDFVNLWTAGRLIGEGRAMEVFDPRAFMAAHRRLFSPALPLHFWSYPPPALFLAAPFAPFSSYFAALGAWTLFGWALLICLPSPAQRGRDRPCVSKVRVGASVSRVDVESRPPPWRRFAPPLPSPLARERVILLLSPAVAVNIGLGQNGAITAGLLLGGLALLERRPALAGAVLGLLVFKPQVALLLPVMVLAGRRWRTLAGAAASAGAVLALSTAVFGVESWRAFLEGSLPMQGQMLRHGAGPFLAMMPSAFASLRLLGVDWVTAMTAQLPFTALGAWLVWSAWRSPGADPVLRAAVLCAATFIATPQAFNYDLIPAAFAALVLWRGALPSPSSPSHLIRGPGAGRALGLRPLQRRGAPRSTLRSSPRETGWLKWGVLSFDAALALAVWSLPATMLLLGPAKAPVAPLVLSALALRLAQRAGTLIPSRSARPSAAGEPASQT